MIISKRLNPHFSNLKTFLRCSKKDYTYLKPISCQSYIKSQGKHSFNWKLAWLIRFESFLTVSGIWSLGWKDGQCMDSYRNWPERELEVFIEHENDWMTPQKCIDICYRKGFAFAGLGFGQNQWFMDRPVLELTGPIFAKRRLPWYSTRISHYCLVLVRFRSRFLKLIGSGPVRFEIFGQFWTRTSGLNRFWSMNPRLDEYPLVILA